VELIGFEPTTFSEGGATRRLGVPRDAMTKPARSEALPRIDHFVDHDITGQPRGSRRASEGLSVEFLLTNPTGGGCCGGGCSPRKANPEKPAASRFLIHPRCDVYRLCRDHVRDASARHPRWPLDDSAHSARRDRDARQSAKTCCEPRPAHHPRMTGALTRTTTIGDPTRHLDQGPQAHDPFMPAQRFVGEHGG
jgi:hypothetical protein